LIRDAASSDRDHARTEGMRRPGDAPERSSMPGSSYARCHLPGFLAARYATPRVGF
jgi:hypothetical protein